MNFEHSPLYLSVDNPITTKTLIDCGTDVNVWLGEPLLMYAVREGNNVKVVEMLLDAGAKLDKKVNEGVTAFRVAADYGLLEIMTLLAKRGAERQHTEEMLVQ